ncbi:ubiquinone biosynthesis regulatory protein kinase UbiB [Porticoccaceae bacterium]|nr:ubiquinone biosynthesis regulatory protein kinase UbiB [Porticoccaceae bacterium]MDB2593903.1 ubiquinone biosynthesis regulatory protein kinase UbiB [Porticoccaceae bacterium]MDB3966356.1 ubiquinone biosynthesis regulatory protein kinase UbiB [Porticoccaceae bacterium]
MRLRRLAKIARVVGKYRLDKLLDKDSLPFSMRALLAPAALFGGNSAPRGERLRMALEELGPIFIKFGQLLSTRPDLVPSDICTELAQLQDNVPPFSPTTFKANIEAALEDTVDNLFHSFEAEPLASASVAQVHAAVLTDGRDVVVKAVRPGIEKTIRKDIALLYTLARLLAKYSEDGRRLRPLEVVADYEMVILEELNLQSEGANASLLRHNFENSPLLYVPEIHWPYSNENVLVMERIYGIPVTNMADLEAAGVDMKLLAERGVEIFFTQVFEHNFFHADMHPGNIFVDASKPKSPSYLAIDCAIMGSLSSDDQFYLARNLLAIFKRDYRQVAELHIRSGWVPADTPVNEFTGAIRSVCEPIFERPLNEISLGHMLISLFNTARRFNMEVQPSLVLLQKTLLNIEGLGRQMYPQLDLWTTAQPFLEKWLKDRYSPKSIFKQFKRHVPDWLEHLPQIPPLIFQALQNMQQSPISTVAPSPVAKEKSSSKPRRMINRFGAALLGIGIGLASPHWAEPINQIPASSLILGGMGLLLLLLR